MSRGAGAVSRLPPAPRQTALCARRGGVRGVPSARGYLPALGLSHNYFRQHAASSFGKEEFGGCFGFFFFPCDWIKCFCFGSPQG